MTTISGTFTADGVSSTLRVGQQPENVSYRFTGPFHGSIALERATSPSESAWEVVAGPFANQSATRASTYATRQKDRLRVRMKDASITVTNGALGASTGWTLAAPWSIGSGVATRTASASNPNLTTEITGLVAGATYVVAFDLTASAGSMTVDLGGGTASAAQTSTGAKSLTLVAGSSNSTLRFIAGATFAGTLDNVTVTPSVAYSISDGDAVVRELKDRDGNVLETQKQGAKVIPGDVEIGGTLTVTDGITGTVNSVPAAEIQTVDPSQKFTLFEDFYGTWAIGDAGPADTWATKAGSGTATEVATTVAGSINGLVTMKSASDDGAHSANCTNLTSVNLCFKANQGGLAMEAKLKISDVSEAVMFVGFTDTVSSTVELPIFLNAANIDSDATDACGVGYDVDGTTKQFFHGGVKNGTDTVPAYSGTAPADDTFFIVRVEVSEDGAVTGYVDGTAIGTAVADAVTATVALCPAIVIGNRSANQVTATVDYVWIQQDR